MSFPLFPHWSFAISGAVPTFASDAAVLSASPVLEEPSLLLALNALLARG